MIIKQAQNTPVAAPAFTDVDAALATYRTWTNNQLYGMVAFKLFIITPSAQRTAFLELFTETANVWNNTYVKRIFSPIV